MQDEERGGGHGVGVDRRTKSPEFADDPGTVDDKKTNLPRRESTGEFSGEGWSRRDPGDFKVEGGSGVSGEQRSRNVNKIVCHVG